MAEGLSSWVISAPDVWGLIVLGRPLLVQLGEKSLLKLSPEPPDAAPALYLSSERLARNEGVGWHDFPLETPWSVLRPDAPMSGYPCYEIPSYWDETQVESLLKYLNPEALNEAYFQLRQEIDIFFADEVKKGYPNFDTLLNDVHRLKGSLATLGLQRLSVLFWVAERACFQHDEPLLTHTLQMVDSQRVLQPAFTLFPLERP